MQAVNLLLADSRGIYIPRDFVTGFDLSLWKGIKEGDAMICENPEHPLYWEAWDEILGYATFEKDGKTYHLYQDGDLWALCFEDMSKEERENFGFEEN